MCRLTELAATRRPVDFDRYARLHEDGTRLIEGWLQRAAEGGGGKEPDFASFIYLWIGFNGFAACVSEKDQDAEWQKALNADPDLNDRFDELLSEPSPTATAAQQFAELWPIFKVADLRSTA